MATTLLDIVKALRLGPEGPGAKRLCRFGRVWSLEIA
jgi:hypothetical protein